MFPFSIAVSFDEEKYTPVDKSSQLRSRGSTKSTESQFRKMQQSYSTSTDLGNSTERGSLDEETSDHAV